MSAKVKRKNPDAMKQRLGVLREIATNEVALGFPKGKAQAYSGNEHPGFEEEGPQEVATVAAKNEYGIGVPRRPFMSASRNKIESECTPIMKAMGRTGVSVKAALNLMKASGEKGKSVIQKKIIDFSTPPNSPKTIALKGESNPLVWTGHMVRSTTYAVRKKGRS